MIKEISKSIEQVVNGLDNTVQGTWNATDTRIDSCDTKWSLAVKPIADQYANN